MGPGAVTAPRRARLLVSGAAAAAVATAVLLALLTAALVAGWGGGPAAAYGSAAFGAAGLAVGLLVLARAGAVARTDAARGRALCIRCCVWALFAVLAVFIVGGVAGYLTRAAAPIWGSTVAGVLLIALVGLAARQRVLLQVRAAGELSCGLTLRRGRGAFTVASLRYSRSATAGDECPAGGVGNRAVPRHVSPYRSPG